MINKILAATVLIIFSFNVNIKAQAPTLDEIFSAPQTTDLITSQSGGYIAWVFNHEGKHSIWITDGDSDPEQLIEYGEDDGRGISDLTFSPDGSFLVYTYGSQFNPTSNPDGANAEIIRLDRSTGDTETIAEGSGAVLSPDGQVAVYQSGGNVFIVNTSGASEPEQLFDIRGSNHSFKWSPDGSKILFVSSREVHSFIGIYDFNTHSVNWVDPDVFRDTNPVWSPTGRRIAFLRSPGGMHHELPGWRRADLPFSIRVYDVGAESSNTVWSSDTGGGFAQSYPSKPLSWAVDNHLVFFSEHNGWMNLYSINIDDQTLIPLAEGEFEVEHLALSPTLETAVISSNEGDINRRHLWSVPVTGGERTQLTVGSGVEWNPAFTSTGDEIAYIKSDAQTPGQPFLMNNDRTNQRFLLRQSIPDSFPVELLTSPEEVVFEAADGVEVHGQLFLPPDYRADGTHPAVIYMHGGPIRQMYPAWHDRGYYHYNYGFNQYLSLNGYVVLSINFRSGIGYGAEFRTAPNQGPRGASEYQDILAGAKFLQKHQAVDPLRIGLWGGSYGGLLTAMGLARDSDLFAAGVDLHGVHDWALRGERRNGGGWGIYTEEQKDLAYRSSPIYDIEWWTSPVLFVHADDDRNVDFIQTTDLVRRLNKIGKVHVETLVFPDDVHSFLLHKNWMTTFEKSADFFDRFLRDE